MSRLPLPGNFGRNLDGIRFDENGNPQIDFSQIGGNYYGPPKSSLDIFTGFFTDYLPAVGRTIIDGVKEVENDIDNETGGVLSDVEKLVKLTITILEKLVEIFPKLLDFAQWIIDYISKFLNDPDLGQKLKVFGWVAVGAVIFWLAFPVILGKIL